MKIEVYISTQGLIFEYFLLFISLRFFHFSSSLLSFGFQLEDFFNCCWVFCAFFHDLVICLVGILVVVIVYCVRVFRVYVVLGIVLSEKCGILCILTLLCYDYSLFFFIFFMLFFFLLYRVLFLNDRVFLNVCRKQEGFFAWESL